MYYVFTTFIDSLTDNFPFFSITISKRCFVAQSRIHCHGYILHLNVAIVFVSRLTFLLLYLIVFHHFGLKIEYLTHWCKSLFLVQIEHFKCKLWIWTPKIPKNPWNPWNERNPGNSRNSWNPLYFQMGPYQQH